MIIGRKYSLGYKMHKVCSRPGTGIGKQIMGKAEEYAKLKELSGLWLWTQSWQAPVFYQRLGFEEFTRFDDFPIGHSRVGLRKSLSNS